MFADDIRVRIVTVENEPLAELTVPENITVGQLYSRIRDDPAMETNPHRLFTHWYIRNIDRETRRALLPTEIPSVARTPSIIGSLIKDIGIRDGTSVIVEVAKSCYGGAAVESSSCSASGNGGDGDSGARSADAMAMAVAADWRAENHFSASMRLVTLLMQKIDTMQTQIERLQMSHEKTVDALSESLSVANSAAVALLRTQVDDKSETEDTRRRQQQRLMTVSTAAPSSVYTVSYSKRDEGERAVITGSEPYFSRPAGERISRPFHFPNTRLSAGNRCLFIFSHTSPSSTTAGLNIGFALTTSEGHTSPSHRYFKDPGAYMLAVYGTNVWRAGEVIKTLPKITEINPKRRIALLLDLSRSSSSSSAAGVCSPHGGDGSESVATTAARFTATNGDEFASTMNTNSAVTTTTASGKITTTPTTATVTNGGATCILGYLRVFVSNDGSEEGMRMLHEDGIPVTIGSGARGAGPINRTASGSAVDGSGNSPTTPSVSTFSSMVRNGPSAHISHMSHNSSSPTYLVCGNMLDKGDLVVHAIHMNGAIPRSYLTYIGCPT